MMRDTRTLKGLFPDPKPPQRKNFIKENVRSLRKMEQLFHSNSKSAKDLKLPALRQRNTTSSKYNEVYENRTTSSNDGLQELRDEEIIAKGFANLMSQKSCQETHNRKKSAPVFSSKKPTLRKVTRPSINGNVIKKSQCCREQVGRTNRNCQKLKIHSEGNMMHEKSSDEICNNEVYSKCKNQSVQTLDTKEMDNLYLEGVIRYPSGRTKTKEKSPDRGDAIQLQERNELDIKINTEHLDNDNIDYVRLNKEHISIASKLATQLNGAAPPPSYRVGVVPKYIKERKEALQKEQLAKTAAKPKDCPTGHVPLPDNERKETLSMLKKNYQEFVGELNMLPIRTDTLRSQQRKMEIEKQLTKLEEAIKVFSRPKVFVKIDS